MISERGPERAAGFHQGTARAYQRVAPSKGPGQGREEAGEEAEARALKPSMMSAGPHRVSSEQ